MNGVKDWENGAARIPENMFDLLLTHNFVENLAARHSPVAFLCRQMVNWSIGGKHIIRGDCAAQCGRLCGRQSPLKFVHDDNDNNVSPAFFAASVLKFLRLLDYGLRRR